MPESCGKLATVTPGLWDAIDVTSNLLVELQDVIENLDNRLGSILLESNPMKSGTEQINGGSALNIRVSVNNERLIHSIGFLRNITHRINL